MGTSLNDVTVSVRCTKAERKAFRKAAKMTGRTLSAFMAWAARLAMDTSPSLNSSAGDAVGTSTGGAASDNGRQGAQPGDVESAARS